MNDSPQLLEKVARRLQGLQRRVVFVGGITTHLHISDSGAQPPTATQDVDLIVQTTSYVEYIVHVAGELRALGAREDTREDAPTCRWIIEGVAVDMMPIDPNPLGFSNRWYSGAFDHALEAKLDDDLSILYASAPFFVATKLEAFNGRGGGDLLSSKDVEDVLAVADGRPELLEELKAAPPELRVFVQEVFAGWLRHRDLEYAIEGYLQGDEDRARVILARLRAIVDALSQ